MHRALLALLLLLLAPLRAQAPVLLLSCDGFAADQLNPRDTPRLWKLAQSGWIGRGIPPFPATTFNGHATLATGCWTGHHGIVGNSYEDPKEGFVTYAATAEQLQREPLWVAATRAGIRTAVYHWPCATGPWEGVLPWRMEIYAPDQAAGNALSFARQALADGALLVLVYHPGTDEVGHHRGPRSGAMRHRLRQLDEELASAFRELTQRHPGLRIILTADHGMATAGKVVRLPRLLPKGQVRIVAHGGSASIWLPEAALPEALRRLKKAGLQAWPADEAPEAFHLEHHPRAGRLLVLAPLGTWLSQGLTEEEFAKEQLGRAGAHAYDPHLRPMASAMVVLGAGRGTLREVPLWDLAPTVAAWLGIPWKSAPDGHPIAALVR